jgi:hypothetical protein
MKEERLKKIAKVAAKYYLSDNSPEWEDEALVISDYVNLYDIRIRDVVSFIRWFRGYVNDIAGYE